MKISSRLKSELFLALATVIWGGTFAIIKTGLHDVSPLLFVAIRFFLAFLFFLPLCIRRRGEITAGTLKAGFILGITMFAGYGLLTAGLVLTTTARSGLISYGYALFVPLLQILFLKKGVKVLNLVGLFLALAGMYIFTSPGASGSSGWNTGDTLTLLAAVSYALNIIFLDRYSRQYDPGILTGIQFAVMAVSGALYVLFFEHPFLHITGSFLFSLLYLTIFGSVAAIFIMNRYQRGTTPVRAVIIYALEPVLAVFSGWLFLGERIGKNGIIGGVIIIGGVVLSEVLGMYLEAKRSVYTL